MARPRSTTARVKMLDSTKEIIIEHGVDACTIEEVASRSGVAKTTIYRHYGGLYELIFAAVSEDVEKSPACDTGSLRDDLIEIQRRYVKHASSPTVRELFVWMMARGIADPAHAELFRKLRVQPQGPTVLALQRAIFRGEVRPTVDIEMAMHMIQGPFISKRIADNSEINSDELEIMVDMAIRAIKG